MRVLQIVSNYFAVGISISRKGVIEDAAPIISYMKGWSIEKVKHYCIRKGWIITEIREEGKDEKQEG